MGRVYCSPNEASIVFFNHQYNICYQTMDISRVKKMKQHCTKVARQVLKVQGDIEITLEPLVDGINFLSDAFFVKVKSQDCENYLFLKVPPESTEAKKQLFLNFP